MEQRKINDKLRRAVFEKVAIDLGFKHDNYYSAVENMFRSCVTTRGGKNF